MYRLATENINAKPSTIYGRNQLFSKLQRQANFEGIGNIIVKAGDDTKSLFSVFRDTFATKLDDLDPTIRELNKRYANIMQKVEDVESTLAKSGKTNAADEIGLAEFAKTNLRRVLSDAQSAAEYQAVLNNLDDFARQAGYAGARADDVIEFATKLRNLYPETIPPTGFAGGIKLGTQGIVEKLGEAVMKAGAPNVVDQRRALKALLDSLAK